MARERELEEKKEERRRKNQEHVWDNDNNEKKRTAFKEEPFGVSRDLLSSKSVQETSCQERKRGSKSISAATMTAAKAMMKSAAAAPSCIATLSRQRFLLHSLMMRTGRLFLNKPCITVSVSDGHEHMKTSVCCASPTLFVLDTGQSCVSRRQQRFASFFSEPT